LSYSYDSFLRNTNPDNFIKPLDIIETSKEKIIHTGIYLGSGKVVHNLGDGVKVDD
jgi:hypothetical protein